jgi:Arc/MetJ family transcription regulator
VGGDKVTERRLNPASRYAVNYVTIHKARTKFAPDDNLIEEARRAGRHKTKKDAVTAALTEYVQRHSQLRILKSFGTVDLRSQLRLQSRAPQIPEARSQKPKA